MFGNGGIVRKRESIGKQFDSGKVEVGFDDLLFGVVFFTSDFLGSETTTGRISVVLCGTSSLFTGETNLVREGYKSLGETGKWKGVGSATRVRDSRGSIPRSDPAGGERSPRYSMNDIRLLSELLESFVSLVPGFPGSIELTVRLSFKGDTPAMLQRPEEVPMHSQRKGVVPGPGSILADRRSPR